MPNYLTRAGPGAGDRIAEESQYAMNVDVITQEYRL